MLASKTVRFLWNSHNEIMREYFGTIEFGMRLNKVKYKWKNCPISYLPSVIFSPIIFWRINVDILRRKEEFWKCGWGGEQLSWPKYWLLMVGNKHESSAKKKPFYKLWNLPLYISDLLRDRRQNIFVLFDGFFPLRGWGSKDIR